MPKKISYKINMKDGTKQEITGTEIIPNYAYDKRNGVYCLTHIPTGILITNSSKAGALKLLCTEPEFLEEFEAKKIMLAVCRFWNKYEWSDSKVKL